MARTVAARAAGTGDRTRETLFSMLASRLGSFDGLRIADLYAGSGALGLEALSRGAAHATFIENDPQAAAIIRANVAALKAEDRSEIRILSVATLPAWQPFDLVFADPPYTGGSGITVAAEVHRSGWLAQGGWLAVETEARDAVDAGPWTIDAERRVGRARLTLIRA
jgi:16S rRNA (guanine966-N2)-methyltransferase